MDIIFFMACIIALGGVATRLEFKSLVTFGTGERLEYTVIGDTVNVASRIESQTKQQKADILVSDGLYQGLGADLKKRLRFRVCTGAR